jgi:hypothetical protein
LTTLHRCDVLIAMAEPRHALGGTLPWSAPEPLQRRPSGDVLERAPMFVDHKGARTWGFSGELLRAFMDDAGWSCGDLQTASGVAAGSIRTFVSGYAQPTEGQVVEMAHALGIEPWDLCFA